MRKPEDPSSRGYLEVLKEIPITEVAEALGFTLKNVGQYFTLVEHDSVRIRPDGKVFYQHSVGKGGTAIDFCMMVGGMSWSETLSYLRKFLRGHGDFAAKKMGQIVLSMPEAPRQLCPPNRDDSKLKRVFAYLTKTRGIAPWIVNSLIDDNRLYADEKGNACFIGNDYDGTAKYGFIRSTITMSSFKRDMTGSDKNVGWSHGLVTQGARPQRLYVTEGIIDALSIMTLRGDTLESEHDAYLSLGGKEPAALAYHLDTWVAKRDTQLDSLCYIALCQDNDAAGRHSVSECANILDERFGTCRGQLKFEVMIPVYKDWNAQLLTVHAQQQGQGPSKSNKQ